MTSPCDNIPRSLKVKLNFYRPLCFEHTKLRYKLVRNIATSLFNLLACADLKFNVVFGCFAERQPFLKASTCFCTVGIWCYRLLLTSRSTHTSLSLALSLVFLFFAGTEDIFDTWFKRKRMVFLNKQCLKPQIAPAIITCMGRLRLKL